MQEQVLCENVQPENLENRYCESCKKKNTATKKHAGFLQIPKYMLMCNKLFEFNMEGQKLLTKYVVLSACYKGQQSFVP